MRFEKIRPFGAGINGARNRAGRQDENRFRKNRTPGDSRFKFGRQLVIENGAFSASLEKFSATKLTISNFFSDRKPTVRHGNLRGSKPDRKPRRKSFSVEPNVRRFRLRIRSPAGHRGRRFSGCILGGYGAEEFGTSTTSSFEKPIVRHGSSKGSKPERKSVSAEPDDRRSALLNSISWGHPNSAIRRQAVGKETGLRSPQR